jgi:hypothetical protein
MKSATDKLNQVTFLAAFELLFSDPSFRRTVTVVLIGIPSLSNSTVTIFAAFSGGTGWSCISRHLTSVLASGGN